MQLTAKQRRGGIVLAAGLLVLAAAGFAGGGTDIRFRNATAGLNVITQEPVHPDARLLTVNTSDGTRDMIAYDWDGRRYAAYFDDDLRESLEAIRDRLPRTATVAAWWDYGHAVRGYTERSVIAVAPSRWAWQHTTLAGPDARWNTTRGGSLVEDSVMTDLSTIFTGTPRAAAGSMDRQGATHMYITAAELDKYAAITRVRHRSEADVTAFSTAQCQRGTGTAECVTESAEDATYTVYRGAGGERWLVPVTESADGRRITGAALVERAGQRNSVPTICGRDGIRTVQPPVDVASVPGCIALHPDRSQAIVYVPRAAMQSTLTRLYLMGGADVDRFSQVYDGPRAQVWRLKR